MASFYQYSVGLYCHYSVFDYLFIFFPEFVGKLSNDLLDSGMNMTVLTSHAKIILKINALKESAISMKRLVLSMKPTEHLTNPYLFAL